MDCAWVDDLLRIRVYRLPSFEEIAACEKEAYALIHEKRDVHVRCEIFGLYKMPSKKHFCLISRFLKDREDDIDGIVLAHRGGRIVRAAQRAFLKLYTPSKPMQIVQLVEYQDDEFEVIDI